MRLKVFDLVTLANDQGSIFIIEWDIKKCKFKCTHILNC
jgi:hypothetical protein